MTQYPWLAGIERILDRNRRRRRSHGDLRVAAAELLETKVLLTANTLGLIQGIAFDDVSGNGLSVDDPMLNAASVQLYRDGGNLLFDDGNVDDTLIGSMTTGPAGTFAFSDLTADRYFVRQQSLVGYLQPVGENVITVDISAVQALGTSGILIDDFSLPADPGQKLSSTVANVPISSFLPIAAAIGGERDMVLTATAGSITLEANGAAFPGFLNYNANFGATGRSRVVWDGADNNATTLSPSGLASKDLTALGETGFQFSIGSNQAVTLTLIVHTGPANSSTATLNLVATDVDSVFVPYATFVTTTGTGANFSNVGAIELLTEAPTAGTATVIDGVQGQSPTRFTANFTNFLPITLGNLVFNDANNNGQFDSSTEDGINDVGLTLFEDTNGNNTFDSSTDLQLATTTTAGGGLYEFTNLRAGTYLVRIDASNFDVGGVLEGFQSSTGVPNDPDLVSANDDDNGEALGDAIVSLAITLANGQEPINDGDSDANSNQSLDFGLFSSVDIVVTKTDNANPVIAGSGVGNLVYTLTTTNLSLSLATDVTINDQGVIAANLPTGVTFVSAVGSDGSTFNTTSGVWTIGALPPGDSRTLVLTLTVDASAADSLVITNTAMLATVNEIEVDAVQGNDIATKTTNVDRSVDILVTKTGNENPVIAGSSVGNLVYTVTATNAGFSNASGVTMSDFDLQAANLPAGVTFVSAVGSSGSTYDSATGIWTIGNLAAGASVTLTATLTVVASAADTLIVNNTASLLNVNETDSNLLNNRASVSTNVDRQVDIAVTKAAAPMTVTAGSGVGNLIFTVSAQNNGPSDASGVTIRDIDVLAGNLPAGVTLVSAIGSANTTFNTTTGIWTIGNLASNASAVLTVTLTAGASAADSGVVANTASLEAVNESDSVGNNNSQQVSVAVRRDVDIAVTKSANSNPVVAGSGVGNLVYVVTARNTGPSNATGVSLLDAGVLAAALPAGVTFVSAVGSGGTSFNTTTGVWNVGNLATTESATLTVTLTVGAAATNGLVINNTATLTTLNENELDLTNNSQTISTTVSRQVDIQVTKSAAPATVIAGSSVGNLVYTVTATNAGFSNASGVTMSDFDLQAANLPAGVTFVSAVGSSGSTYDSATGIWTIGNLAAGASVTLTATLTVVASAADTLIVNNTASLLNVNETDSNLLNNRASVSTNVDRQVDIAVTKAAAPMTVTAGSGVGNLIFTITTRNIGPSQASGVTVRDNALLASNLPSYVTLVSAIGDGGSTYDSATGIWTIGNLAASVTRTLTVTVTVGANAAPQTFNNVVNVAHVNEIDSNQSNNTAAATTVFRRSVDIQVTKTATPGPVIAGSGVGNLVYVVTARNTGPSNATGVVVAEFSILAANLPAGVTFVSATGSSGSTFNALTGFWTIGNMVRNASETLTVTLSVGASASDTLTIANKAELLAVTETDSNPQNNWQTVITEVDRRVDIVVTKTAAPAIVVAGSGIGNLVYTVNARNAGSSDATGVTIADLGVLAASLPSGVSFISAVSSEGAEFNNSTGIWSIGRLAAGASRTLLITLTVGSTVLDGLTIINTATVATVTETETNIRNNTASVSTTVLGHIDLVVVKTGTPNPVMSPGLLTYTVRVTNVGTARATGVVLTDNLGPGMTFLSGTSTQGVVTYADGIVTTTIGTINSGATVTLTLDARVNVALAGTLVNTASAMADQTDPNLLDNTSTIETQALLSPVSVSGVVFQDLNSNGLKNSGERPLPNVPIVLFGIDVNGAVVNLPSLTDLNGAYSFVDLEPGDYSVYEIQPTALLDGKEIAGTGAFCTVAKNAFLNLSLNPGVNATGFNFTEGPEDTSLRPFFASSQNVRQTQIVALPALGSGSLSGMVAIDSNRNSVLDNGDIGLPGVIVTLAGNDAGGTPLLIHQSTDSLGRYAFVDLPNGQYSIREVQPKGKIDGPEQVGTILPDQVLDDVFSAIALAHGAAGTGFNFLELPAIAGMTAAISPTWLTPSTFNVGLRPTFSWTPFTAAARYDVSILQIAGNKGEVYRNRNVSGTSLTIPTDLDLGAHRVWVRSVNAAGVSGRWSQPLSFSVDKLVNALAGTSVSMNARSTLDWADIPQATSYDMRLINVETGSVLANVGSLPSSQSSGLATLLPGKYRYFVRGNTASGSGQWSDGYDYTILSNPTLKTVTSTDTATPTLHWNPVKGAATYEVYLTDLSAVGGAKRITSVNKTNGTSLPVPTSLGLGHYRYTVRAIDAHGQMTSWSSPGDFKVETIGRITSPTGPVNTAFPTITWKQIAGAVRYDIWIADKLGNVCVRDRNVTGTSYTSAKAFLNGEYRAWVMAIGTTSSGKWSQAADFMVKVVARPTLTLLGATGSSTPTLKWTASSGAVRYELRVDKVGRSSTVIHETNLATNAYKSPTPLRSDLYRAWVRAFDSTGLASVWSDALDFSVV